MTPLSVLRLTLYKSIVYYVLYKWVTLSYIYIYTLYYRWNTSVLYGYRALETVFFFIIIKSYSTRVGIYKIRYNVIVFIALRFRFGAGVASPGRKLRRTTWQRFGHLKGIKILVIYVWSWTRVLSNLTPIRY